MPGEDLPHVSHYYDEAHGYYRKQVVIVGGKNSAAEVALELHRSGAHVTIVHRRATLGSSIKYWVKPDIENRIAEGSIAARFESRVVEIRADGVVIESRASGRRLPADHVFLMTGYHADFDLLEACGVDVDPATGVPSTIRRHWKATCRTCFSPAVCSQGRIRRRSSSRTGDFTGRESSRFWRNGAAV